MSLQNQNKIFTLSIICSGRSMISLATDAQPRVVYVCVRRGGGGWSLNLPMIIVLIYAGKVDAQAPSDLFLSLSCRFFFFKKNSQTRMHSSRMHTACLLTVSHSIPCILRDADPFWRQMPLDADPPWMQTPPVM